MSKNLDETVRLQSFFAVDWCRLIGIALKIKKKALHKPPVWSLAMWSMRKVKKGISLTLDKTCPGTKKQLHRKMH